MKNIIVSGQLVFSRNVALSTADLHGRSHSILPAVMMIEGAYSPSIGDNNTPETLFFSAEEMEKSLKSWNGRPVSLNHPSGNQSCNSPELYNSQWLGYVFNTKYDSDRRSLSCEMWLDNERASDLVDMVVRGDKVDVSIGAYGDIEERKGISNGIEYNSSISNIVGDHLAVLPNDRGACGWGDGCGIRAKRIQANNVLVMEKAKLLIKDLPSSDLITAIRSTSRTPSYSGVETTSWGDVDKSLGNYVKAYYKLHGGSEEEVSSRIADLSSEVRTWIASKSLLGDKGAEDTRGLIFFPVVNPGTDKLNYDALRAVLSGRGSQADINSSVLISARNKATELIRKEFTKNSERNNEMNDMVSVNDKIVKQNESKSCPQEVHATKEAVMPKTRMSFKEFLDSAPVEYKEMLEDQNNTYLSLREGLVNNVNSFDEIRFDESFLMSLKRCQLQKISDLVDCAKRTVEDNQTMVGATNFSVNGAKPTVAKKDYVVPNSIDWSM